jgi:hypothetical protein
MNGLRVDLVMSDWRQVAQGHFLKRRALRRFLTVAVAGSLWIAAAGTAQATTSGSPDAAYSVAPNSSLVANNRSMLGQTFKALSTGQLDQVELTIAVSSGGSGDIYIVPADPTTGKPSVSFGPSTAHYSGFVNCCTPQKFTIAPKFPVTANGTYAITVIPAVGSFTWSSVKSGTYGGQAFMGVRPSSWFVQAMVFDFKTWVEAGSANQPPTIKANNGSVPVDEGAVPANSGTYSDPGGDTVTLAATSDTGSAGTVTPNLAAGTWSWKGAPADEGPGQTITITATDSKGLAALPITFTTVVGSVTPTVTIHGAPASGAEGTSIALTASALSPSAEDNAAGFSYKWTATKNGSAFGSGIGASFSVKPNDEGTYVVKLEATDDGGYTGVAYASITGANVAPTATIISVTQPAMVLVTQESVTFTGSFTDPGLLDDHTVTWDFGDGTSSTTTILAGGPTTFSTTHAYSRTGYLYADLTVTDDDNGASKLVGVTVDILTPADAMSRMGAFVQTRPGLNGGQKNSLQAKLNAATDSYSRGNAGAACNQLGAFTNDVGAQQKAGHLTANDSATLTGAARATQLSMGCFRTLVEFLSGL